jgi:hypothetical protein
VGRRVQRGQLGESWEGGGAELPLVATPGEDPGRGRAGLGRRKLTMHALHQPGQAGTPPWAARGRGEGLCAGRATVMRTSRMLVYWALPGLGTLRCPAALSTLKQVLFSALPQLI